MSAAESGNRLRELEEENQRLKETLRRHDQFIRQTFGRYLTDEVLDDILKNRDQLTFVGELRTVTMMFADLRGSTDLSEKMTAADFIRMLNHFLEDMIEIINAWQGNILEFVGDAIVTVFGAPRENRHHAKDAAACAVAMQRRMEAVNEWNRSQGYPDIAMGIGIHTGEAILGNIGSLTRAKYDMIGRNVNLASRIQTYSDGGQILISDETLSGAGSQIMTNPAGAMRISPKGIRGEVLVHDVIGFARSVTPRGIALDAITERKASHE